VRGKRREEWGGNGGKAAGGIEGGGGLCKERGPFIRPKIPQFSRFFFCFPDFPFMHLLGSAG